MKKKTIERLLKSNFYKTCSKEVVVKRGSWVNQNHVFSKCTKCNKMSIYRICQSCGNVDLDITEKQKKMVEIAIGKHGTRITPCFGKKNRNFANFVSCFNSAGFWYNEKKYTHLIRDRNNQNE